MKGRVFSKQEVKITLHEVYERFVQALSDGEDCLYAKLLKQAIEETEEDL